jgi:hypothetical protein
MALILCAVGGAKADVGKWAAVACVACNDFDEENVLASGVLDQESVFTRAGLAPGPRTIDDTTAIRMVLLRKEYASLGIRGEITCLRTNGKVDASTGRRRPS